ncbi:MAG: amino acid adenylation domain-containing protein [Planctomycetales bacterium]
MNDEDFMRMALSAARRGVEVGQAPFGACLVRHGEVLACLHNLVRDRIDVTAHAEVNVLRATFERLGTTDLSGCALYTTCEPCPMCFSACHDARIERIVYGAGLEDAQRHGFLGFSIPSATLAAAGLRSVRLEGGILRNECVQLLETYSPLKNGALQGGDSANEARLGPDFRESLVVSFERHAAQRPDAPALTWGAETLTYGQLNALANRLAERLLARGAGPERIVAISVPRSLRTIIGILGILKSGAAYLHISLDYPPARRQFLLEDSQAGLIVVDADAPDDIAPGVERVVVDDGPVAAAHATNPPRTIGPDQLAYVMYTSGTTGQPNGVIVTHGNLARLFPQVRRQVAWDETDVWTMVHTASFGFSVWEMWGALSSGGRLVIVPADVVQDPEQLHELVLREQVTVLSQTPTAFRLFDWANETSRSTTPLALRMIAFSGEQLPAEVVRSWVRRHGDERPLLINTYAATETSGQVALHRVRESDFEQAAAPSVGRPLEDVFVRLLDPQGKPAAPGDEGELYLGGPAVARGYWRRPELTAARFLEHHPAAIDGDGQSQGRLYRTGDLARWRSDGELEYLGRVDRQVKISGFRVEPSEIEGVLRQVPGVRDCLVVAGQHSEDSYPQLVAYVVPDSPLHNPPPNAANATTTSSNANEGVSLWPSLGEYQVYDAWLYDVMNYELQEHAGFRRMIERRVGGRVVADLGTGHEALLARLCLEAGARRVYAIEVLEEPCRAARALVERLGLNDRIIVLQGDAAKLTLDEPVDVLISRLMGNIGSSDGLIPILNAARRLLGPGGVVLPGRCITRMAAVTLPESLRNEPQFALEARPYVERIFEQMGGPFDVRLCVQGFSSGALLSTSAIFEDLDFSCPVPEFDEREAELTIDQGGRCDGLVLWLTAMDGEEVVADYLNLQRGWLPVFIPLFDPGETVAPGETLQIRWKRQASATLPFPEYVIEGDWRRRNGDAVHFQARTGHGTPARGSSRFWERLHERYDLPPRRPDGSQLLHILRQHIQGQLPEYMRPHSLTLIDRIPQTANGKVNLAALPSPGLQRPEPDAPWDAERDEPRTEMERRLAKIWTNLLNLEPISRYESFLDLGGSSLLAVRAVAQIEEQLGPRVKLSNFFQQNLAQLAATIESQIGAAR